MGRWALGVLVLVGWGMACHVVAAPFVWPAAWTVSTPGEARAGGIVREGRVAAYTTLNPFVYLGVSLWGELSGNGLLILNPATFQFEPYMAESYSISKDKLTWTLKLRPGIRWSDGRPIVADDFVLALKIARATHHYLEDDYLIGDKPIQVSKLDDSTLRFVFPIVLATAAELIAELLPRPSHVFGSVFEAKGADGVLAIWGISENPENIVTAGPFVYKGYRPGERALLARNAYFGEWNKDAAGRPLPYLDGRELLILKDINAHAAAFAAGEVDLFIPRLLDQLSLVKKLVAEGKLKAVVRENIGPAIASSWLVFNWNRRSDPEKQRLFRSSEFRRAISHLLDRKAMIELGFGGFGRALYASVPLAFSEWIPEALNKYDYDPQAAATLLAKLGYNHRNTEGYLVNSQGRVLEFNLITTVVYEVFYTIFQDTLKKAGVKVNVQVRDQNSVLNLLGSSGDDRPFDAVWSGGLGVFLEYPLTADFYTCAGNTHLFNKSGSCLFPWETQVSALFSRGLQETDRERRKKIVWQLLEIWSTHQPFIYTPRANVHRAWSTRLSGEFPPTLINPYFGERDVDLTLSWIRP